MPRGKKKQREFIEQVVQEVLQLNPLTTRASSAERLRDNIRANRDGSRSSQRQSRFDQNRLLSQDEFFTLSSPNTQNSQNRADTPFTQSQLRGVFSQDRSQRPFQSASHSRSPSPLQRQNWQNVADRGNYQFRARSNERTLQNPRQSQNSQPFSGIMPAQRVGPTATHLEEPTHSSYNSGADRLRSQNSLFNSGEIRNYRDQQSSAECNYNNQQRYQSRAFSQEDLSIEALLETERIATLTVEIPRMITTGVAAQVEREREQQRIRFCSPSPMNLSQQRYNPAQCDHYIIRGKSPRDIHIRVTTEETSVLENN